MNNTNNINADTIEGWTEILNDRIAGGLPAYLGVSETDPAAYRRAVKDFIDDEIVDGLRDLDAHRIEVNIIRPEEGKYADGITFVMAIENYDVKAWVEDAFGRIAAFTMGAKHEFVFQLTDHLRRGANIAEIRATDCQ